MNISSHVPANIDYGKLPLIGHYVSFTMGRSGIQVHKEQLQDLLDRFGMGDMMPNDITRKTAMHRALNAYVKDVLKKKVGASSFSEDDDLDGDGESESLFIQAARPKTVKGKGHWLFYVVNRKVDWAKSGLSFLTNLRVFLYDDGQVLVTTTGDGDAADWMHEHNIANQINPYCTLYGDLYMGSDIGPIIKGFLKRRGAVATRKEGGVWWVPDENVGSLETLSDFMGALPITGVSRPDFVALPVLDTPAARQQLANAVHNGLLAEIAAMEADLAGMLTRAKEKPGTVSADTVDKRLREYRQLSQRLDIYADLLSMRTDVIEDKIKSLKAQARNIIYIQTEDSAPVTTTAGGAR